MTGDTDGADARGRARPSPLLDGRRSARRATAGARPRRSLGATPRAAPASGRCRASASGAARPCARRASSPSGPGGSTCVALCLNYAGLAAGRPRRRSRGSRCCGTASRSRREHGATRTSPAATPTSREMLFRLDRLRRAGAMRRRRAGVHRRARLLRPTPTTSNVHRCLLALRRGDWADAEAGLRGPRRPDDDPGMLAGHSRPPLRPAARPPRRRRRRAAARALAWERALRQRSAALPRLRRAPRSSSGAWLADRADRADTVLDGLGPARRAAVGRARAAEILR